MLGPNLPDILLTGPDDCMPPLVRVFDPKRFDLKLEFMAYEPTITGGVRVAVGDVNWRRVKAAAR